MTDNNSEKTILFIDNSYAFSGMRGVGWRFSWEKVLNFLEKDGSIRQVYFFASEHRPPKDNQRNFYKMLSSQLSFEMHLGETKQKTITVQDDDGNDIQRTVYLDKGLDVRLVTWLLKLLINNAFDNLIIISGDGDYADALRTVKERGCTVEVVGWKNSVAKSLEEISSTPVLYLDDIRTEIERDEDHLL